MLWVDQVLFSSSFLKWSVGRGCSNGGWGSLTDSGSGRWHKTGLTGGSEEALVELSSFGDIYFVLGGDRLL